MAVGCHKKAFDHPISRLHSRSFNFRLLFRHKYGYWIQFFCLLFQIKSKSENICVKGEINELPCLILSILWAEGTPLPFTNLCSSHGYW